MKSKAIILTVVVCLLLASLDAVAHNNSNGQAETDNKQAIEEEILRLEEVGRQKVLKGDTNWDDLIADDAYMIGYDGSVIHYRKGQSLPSMPMKSFKLSEMIARVYGDISVVTGLAEVESETPEKKAFSFQMRFINVWKRSKGSWKIVVSERTGVRAAAK